MQLFCCKCFGEADGSVKIIETFLCGREKSAEVCCGEAVADSRHQLAADAPAAKAFQGGHRIDIPCGKQLAVRQKRAGQQVSHGAHLPVLFTHKRELGRKVGAVKFFYIIGAVAESFGPNCTKGRQVIDCGKTKQQNPSAGGSDKGGRKFFDHHIGLVGELCPAKTRVAEIILTVDIEHILWQVRGKLIVYHGIGAVWSEKSLLNVNNKAVAAVSHTCGKGNHLALNTEKAALHAKLKKVGKGVAHGTFFLDKTGVVAVGWGIVGAVVQAAPLTVHSAALFQIFGSDGLIAPVGRLFEKVVYVGALGVQLLSGKSCQLFTGIYVIEVVTELFKHKLIGKELFQLLFCLWLNAHKPELGTAFFCICNECIDDGSDIAEACREEICGLGQMQLDNEKVVDEGNLRIICTAPVEYVGEAIIVAKKTCRLKQRFYL